ncbi:MAG: hypothetical protein ACOX7P_02935 [Oscillospiraceae bacterium]
MKKSIILVSLLALLVSISGCTGVKPAASPAAPDTSVDYKAGGGADEKASLESGEAAAVTEAEEAYGDIDAAEDKAEIDDMAAVIKLVDDFSAKLQYVYLLSPDSASLIEEYYGEYVEPALLIEWQNDPLSAPGRLVSSPWPDHIEISTVAKLPDGGYEVKGKIIEVTSAEAESGGAAARREIELTVARSNDKWLISGVTLGSYETDSSIKYVNNQYCFGFTLPISWKDFSVVCEEWSGKETGTGAQSESGPVIYIRHPEWTEENPRQDIPIMIFTLPQWEKVLSEKLSVGAAPVPPSELGRNTSYVFALPARYNFSFLPGYEEVEEILAGNPFEAFD